MWRNIGAVVLGYVVMFAVAFVTFSIGFLIVGTTGAFEEGSYDVTVLWLVISFALGLIVAVVGGFACAAVAKSSKAPLALAGLVLVVGGLMALPVLTASDDGPPEMREADVSTFDAMQKGKQPPWVAFANPFVGVIGVLLGSKLGARRGQVDLRKPLLPRRLPAGDRQQSLHVVRRL